MSAERPNPSSPGACVLIVGLRPDVLEHVSKALAPRGQHALVTSLARLREDTEQHKPIIVFVDAYLYDFDPKAFDKLALEAGAKLGVVSNAKEALALLEKLQNAGPPKATAPNDSTKQGSRRQEFTTAKYDAKTLQDALERMSSKGLEFDTARYDAKALRKALKKMSAKISESETNQQDAKKLQAVLDQMTSNQSVSETVQYDAKTLRSALEKMTPPNGDSETAAYDAAKLQKLLDGSDD